MDNTNLTLIMMAGLPGAGKTTLSKELGNDLGWQVINKDEYKEALMKRGLGDDESSREAYEESFRLVFSTLLDKRKSVILDSAALQPFIVDRAKEIVQYVERAQLKVILLVASRDLRDYRIRSRPPQITKIPFNPATEAEYYECFKHLPPRTKIINTIKTIEECKELAEDYLMSSITTENDKADMLVSIRASIASEPFEMAMT